MDILPLILISFLTLAIFSFLLTGAKLTIYMFFSFLYEKKIWLEYLIFHALMIIAAAAPILIFNEMETSAMVLYVILPILIVFGFIEFLYFYTKHFDYESKKKYITALMVSYLANFGILNVGFYIFLALWILVAGI